MNISRFFYAIMTFVILLSTSIWGQTSTFQMTNTAEITQTGTGTDYSGLENIAGVTLFTVGSGDTEKKLYLLNDLSLRIDGDLTINPKREQLLFTDGLADATNEILVSGSLTIIDEENYGTADNSKTYYAQQTPFVFTRARGTSWRSNHMHILIEDNATLNLYGVHIDLTGNRGIQYSLNSSGIIRDVSLRGGFEGNPRLHLLGELDIEGLQVYDFFAINLDDNFTSLKGLVPHNSDYAMFYDGGINGGENLILTIEDFDFFTGNDVNNTYYTIAGEASIKWQLKNKVSGTEGFVTLLRANNANSKYAVEILQDIDFTIVDANGNAVEAIVYATDIDHSQRRDYTAGNETTNTNYTNTRTYLQATTAGKAAFRDILTAAVAVNNSNQAGYYYEADPTPAPIDYRTKTTDGTDVLDFYIYSYGYQPATASPELRGAGVKESNQVLVVDNNISQSDKSTVDAYTEIETLDKLYDRAISWKIDNVGEEYPTIGTQLVSSSGDSMLDLGEHNLVVDATATAAFAVDTASKTITIKANSLTAGSKFTSITTTGTVTTQNSALINHGYIEDDNGSEERNIYINFNWLTGQNYDIDITDLDAGSAIGTTYTDQSSPFRQTFISPTPQNGAINVEIKLTDTSDGTTYTYNLVDANELAFNLTTQNFAISLAPTIEAQHETLFMAQKLLQKTESLSAALAPGNTTVPAISATPTITVTSTTGDSETVSKQNQDAIEDLLKRVLQKATANEASVNSENQ